MFARTEHSLRSAALSCRIQPILSCPSAYHTTSISAPAARLSNLARAKPYAMFSQNKVCSGTSIRYASAAAVSQQTQSNQPPLDWNTFFKLRKTRRRMQLGSSVGTTAFGMLAGAQVLAISDMEKIVSQVPLDPFITLGLITFSCGGLGWLMGPVVGTAIFNTLNRKHIPEMVIVSCLESFNIVILWLTHVQKEKEFYSRIKKFRVDPSASSMSNPVPDYYGEKISSVKDYRQWLKDQRAFNKKRTTYVKL